MEAPWHFIRPRPAARSPALLTDGSARALVLFDPRYTGEGCYRRTGAQYDDHAGAEAQALYIGTTVSERRSRDRPAARPCLVRPQGHVPDAGRGSGTDAQRRQHSPRVVTDNEPRQANRATQDTPNGVTGGGPKWPPAMFATLIGTFLPLLHAGRPAHLVGEPSVDHIPGKEGEGR